MSDPLNTGEIRTVPFRGGGFAPVSIRWIGLVVFVTLLVLAEIGTQTGFITPLTLPKPSDVLKTFGELYSSGLLWKHLSVSPVSYTHLTLPTIYSV